jgi:hypothetical protein
MLSALNGEQAHFIALLVKAARMQRDELIGHVAEEVLGGIRPVRGEHNPTVGLGFAPLAPDSEQLTALRDAMAALPPAARVELYCLMRVGQGHLAAKTLHRGISDAGVLDEAAVTGALMDDPDLHDHLEKGLYELERE